jgi:type II secretory pathway component PulF
MPLFVTPGYLTNRAVLYQQLNQLTAAGITLQSAIEMQQRSPPARSLRHALAAILEQLESGATFADALVAAGRWVPAFDIALLHAGEQSGRLPACFQLLAQHYENSAQLLRQTISGLLYPALLFHMAVFIAPLPEFFRTWDATTYLGRVFVVLLPVYGIFAAVGWLMNGQKREGAVAMVEALLHRVPILGKARRNLALARLASALEALISAGVPIFQAWEYAGTASGSPALRRAIERWKPDFANGVTPAQALQQTREFPEIFANLYQTGELTGSLDDTLRRLHVLHQSEGARQMKALAEWTPKLIYFGVILMVAWMVIRFWTGYFKSIGDAIQF